MPREGKVTSVCACSSAVCSSAVVLLCCAGGKMQTKTPSRRSHSSRVTYHQVCLPCNWPLVSVAHLLCCSAAGARHMLSTCCCCCCCCSVLMLLMLLCCFRERSKKVGNVYPFDKPLKDPPPLRVKRTHLTIFLGPFLQALLCLQLLNNLLLCKFHDICSHC